MIDEAVVCMSSSDSASLAWAESWTNVVTNKKSDYSYQILFSIYLTLYSVMLC